MLNNDNTVVVMIARNSQNFQTREDDPSKVLFYRGGKGGRERRSDT